MSDGSGGLVWAGTQPLGCVLVHGFTATPEEVRSLGDALAAAGYPTCAVCLPGHGTRVEDLARARWRQWIGVVEGAVATAGAHTPRVLVAGFSMGALLAIVAAADRRVPVHGLVLGATPLVLGSERPMMRWLPWVPPLLRPRTLLSKPRGRDILDAAARERSVAYASMPLAAVVELLALRARARTRLARITQPTLVVHGRQDRTAPVVNVDVLREGLRHARVETTIFEHSAHVLTEDAERDAVAARVLRFVETLATPPA